MLLLQLVLTLMYLTGSLQRGGRPLWRPARHRSTALRRPNVASCLRQSMAGWSLAADNQQSEVGKEED